MKLGKKKEKILYILAGTGFILLALLILALLVRGAPVRPAPEGENEPTPAPTAAPATAVPGGLVVGGKSTAPDSDSCELTGRPLTGEDMAAIASLQNLTTLSLSNCGVSDLRFLRGLYRLRTMYLPDNDAMSEKLGYGRGGLDEAILKTMKACYPDGY